MEVSKNELSKLMMVGTELAKASQEIKRAWGPKPDENKDRDKKGKGQGKKKRDAVNRFPAEEDTPTINALYRSPCSQGSRQDGRRMVLQSTPPHPRRGSSIPPDVYQAECREQERR